MYQAFVLAQWGQTYPCGQRTEMMCASQASSSGKRSKKVSKSITRASLYSTKPLYRLKLKSHLFKSLKVIELILEACGVIPAKAGIWIDFLEREAFFIAHCPIFIWIPAFAGMTSFLIENIHH